ncbi:MAG TPA: sigma-70 family RNA polymerase sigma factor [Pirellulaceae bacterium]|nr:sigma-70 family RNA polymerase sigma factor [Pirellulaceae bacterium]
MATDPRRVPLHYIDHPDFHKTTAHSAWLTLPLPESSGDLSPTARNMPAYLASLYAAPLWTREQESAAFLRYNYQKFCQRLEQAKGTRELIIRANLRLVVSIAKPLWQRDREDLFELVSEGNVALLRAIEHFDVAQGIKFSTYATTAIRRHLYRHLQLERKRSVRFPLGLESEHVTVETTGDEAERHSAQSYATEVSILKLVERLEPRERRIITARFGLLHEPEQHSFTELGAQLGVSKERARQITNRALQRLRAWALESGVTLA